MNKTVEELERELAETNHKLEHIHQREQELRPKVLGVLQRTMQQNLDLFEISKASSGMLSQADLNVALDRSRMVRDKLAGMEEFSKELYELDIQIQLLTSMSKEALPVENAGGGKVRGVPDEVVDAQIRKHGGNADRAWRKEVLEGALEYNRKAIEKLRNRGGITPIEEAELAAQVAKAVQLRDQLATENPGEFAASIKELDEQVDALIALTREDVPMEASAGKVRVLNENRVARDRHSQVRDFPLRDKIAKLAGREALDAAAENPELETPDMNAEARAAILGITGRPLIKVIDEILAETFPDLLKAFYPRIYENVGHYSSPRDCAVMLANVIAESLRYGPSRIPAAYQMIMPALSYMKARRMPMFFIAPDLLEAVLRTDFDDDIDWTELSLPYESGVFVLPRGALVHPKDGDVAMLVWSRTKAGDHPSPWLGLPTWTTAKDSFVILGACLKPMIWYDSIFAANVRRTVRLNNMFYREPGEVIPSTKKVTKLDADLTEEDSEFVEKMGVIVFGTLMAMNARPALVERGQLLKRVGAGTEKAREFWSPNVIGAKYKIKREVAKIVDRKFVMSGPREHGTHASPRMHWRRGHYRQQPVGPGRKERKQIWLEPTLIGAE